MRVVPRAATTSDVFNAIAESRRRDILVYLAPRERPVGDIVAALELPQPSVSKHLKVLRDVGLVDVRRDGRQMFYRTNAGRDPAAPRMDGTFERFWRHQLTRVKERAERKAKRRNTIRRRKTVALTAPTLDNLTLIITEEIHVRASLDATFEALLEQMGPGNETAGRRADADGRSRRGPAAAGSATSATTTGTSGDTCRRSSGRRCSRSRGRCSCRSPVVSNVQYRLKEVDGGTLIAFRHSALGFVPDDFGRASTSGWTPLHERIRKQATRRGRSREPHDVLKEETSCQLIEALLQELEQEAQTTRRVLERVPGDRLGWKPHDRVDVARPAGAARRDGAGRHRRDARSISPFRRPAVRAARAPRAPRN